MSIKVTIPVSNAGAKARRFMVPKGMLVEVNTPGMQNVVTAQSLEVELKPAETKNVVVDAYCVNRNKSWPVNASGKLTKQSYGLPFSDQSDVWRGIGTPDMDDDPMAGVYRKLRREMEDLTREHTVLKIVANDVGVKYDNLHGTTLSDKCFYLIEFCKNQNRIPKLVERLLEDYERSVVLNEMADSFRSAVA